VSRKRRTLGATENIAPIELADAEVAWKVASTLTSSGRVTLGLGKILASLRERGEGQQRGRRRLKDEKAHLFSLRKSGARLRAAPVVVAVGLGGVD
jgi:hypothetical protein